MATKQQLQQWAKNLAELDTEGLSSKQIESLLDDAASTPHFSQVFPPECKTPWQKFQWAARNNARAIGEVIRGD